MACYSLIQPRIADNAIRQRKFRTLTAAPIAPCVVILADRPSVIQNTTVGRLRPFAARYPGASAALAPAQNARCRIWELKRHKPHCAAEFLKHGDEDPGSDAVHRLREGERKARMRERRIALAERRPQFDLHRRKLVNGHDSRRPGYNAPHVKLVVAGSEEETEVRRNMPKERSGFLFSTKPSSPK